MLEDELVEMRRHLDDKNRLQRELDRQVVEQRTIAAEAERQLAGIRRTLSYRVGHALVGAVGSWRGFFALPWRLYRIWHGQRLKRKGPATKASARPADRLRFVEETLKRSRAHGLGAAHRHVSSINKRMPQEKARALVELAVAHHREDPAQAGRLGAEAAVLNPRESRLRTLIFDLYDIGAVAPSAAVLTKTSPDLFKSSAHQQRAALVRSDAAELAAPFVLPLRVARERVRGRHLAIVAPRSPPGHADVVSHRAQAVALAAIAAGWEATIVTEPGYQMPADADGKAVRQLLDDGVAAVRLPVGLAHPSAVRTYVPETGALIAAQLVALGADLVHVVADGAVPLACSAAVAARSAGLEYVLDLGNVPAAGGPGRSGWEASERFAAQVSRLSTLAAGARAALFRSEMVADLLAPRIGVAAPLIVHDALPSGFAVVDELAAQGVRRELGGIEEDRPLISMFGVIGGEEGALRVVEAMARVRDAVPRACLVFFGSGRMGSSVRRIAAQCGLIDCVVVPDAFIRRRLPDYVGSSAVTVVGSRGEGPAGLAMPIELLAALAIGTPLVVAEAAFAAEWNCGESGPAVMATDGSTGAIADALIAVLSDQTLRARLREAGRACIAARGEAARVIAVLLEQSLGVA